MSFERNVFVNCPFDDAYRPLLHSLLFTVYYLGFQPRIALESRDSGRPRIDRIVELIRDSKYAIHDLSRVQATAVGEFFRLNMPFELGVDFGCRMFRPGPCSQKQCLILGADRYDAHGCVADRARVCGSRCAASEQQGQRSAPARATFAAAPGRAGRRRVAAPGSATCADPSIKRGGRR